MLKDFCVGAGALVFVAGLAHGGHIADFEDVPGFSAAPFVSGGLNFSSTHAENLIFDPGAASGAQNGTRTFGWCGTDCGSLQIITVSNSTGDPFDLVSLDASNLHERSLPLGFRDGMTLEAVGYFSGGGTISQTLSLFEDTFETFTFAGFLDLEYVEFSAPATSDGAPDPVIDNIVYMPIPAPGTLAILALGGVVGSRRQR